MPPICKLCSTNVADIDSHIIPRFLYRRLKWQDDAGKIGQTFVSASTDGAYKKETKEAKQYLLCRLCDQRIGRWEGKTARILKNPQPPKFCGDEFREFSRFDYLNFKLFVLSYLWRASVSNLPIFAEFTLGTHEPKVEQMVLTGEAGCELDYGLIILNLRFNGKSIGPVVSSVGTGRMGWYFALEKYMIVVLAEKSDMFLPLLLRKDGPYRSYDREMKDFDMFKAFI